MIVWKTRRYEIKKGLLALNFIKMFVYCFFVSVICRCIESLVFNLIWKILLFCIILFLELVL